MTATPEKAEIRTAAAAFCYWAVGRIGLAFTCGESSTYVQLRPDQAYHFAKELADAIAQYEHLERGLGDACGEKP